MHLLQSSQYFKGRQWFGVVGSHKGDGWVGRRAGQAKLKPLAGVCLDSVLLVSARNTCPPEIQNLRSGGRCSDRRRKARGSSSTRLTTTDLTKKLN
jgi:hypothetical protein